VRILWTDVNDALSGMSGPREHIPFVLLIAIKTLVRAWDDSAGLA
jgi:hypothetical protein